MPGYIYIHANSPTNAGGVGIYISQQCQHQISSFNIDFDVSENLWLSITFPYTKVKFTVGEIYRHFNTNFKNFCDALNETLIHLSTLQKQFFIMGDFNIDTSEKSTLSNRMSIQYYLNMLASHGAETLINKATRVTSTTATVIDHIFTNVTQYSITPGVIRYDLTDYYPIFVKACNYCNNSRTRHAVKT